MLDAQGPLVQCSGGQVAAALTGAPSIATMQEQMENTGAAMIGYTFRELLLSSIAFVVGRERALLRRLLKEHVTDDTRHRLAEKVVEHLELSGFEIDEAAQIIRKRPPTHGHGDD
jgi:hypothetical protein